MARPTPVLDDGKKHKQYIIVAGRTSMKRMRTRHRANEKPIEFIGNHKGFSIRTGGPTSLSDFFILAIMRILDMFVFPFEKNSPKDPEGTNSKGKGHSKTAPPSSVRSGTGPAGSSSRVQSGNSAVSNGASTSGAGSGGQDGDDGNNRKRKCPDDKVGPANNKEDSRGKKKQRKDKSAEQATEKNAGILPSTLQEPPSDFDENQNNNSQSSGSPVSSDTEAERNNPDYSAHVPPERILPTAGPAYEANVLVSQISHLDHSAGTSNSLSLHDAVPVLSPPPVLHPLPKLRREMAEHETRLAPTPTGGPSQSPHGNTPPNVSEMGEDTQHNANPSHNNGNIHADSRLLREVVPVIRCDRNDNQYIYQEQNEPCEVWRLIPFRRETNTQATGRHHRAFSNHIGYNGRAEAWRCHDCEDEIRGPRHECHGCGRPICQMCLPTHQCRRFF